jgi:hypothetical protein
VEEKAAQELKKLLNDLVDHSYGFYLMALASTLKE